MGSEKVVTCDSNKWNRAVTVVWTSTAVWKLGNPLNHAMEHLS